MIVRDIDERHRPVAVRDYGRSRGEDEGEGVYSWPRLRFGDESECVFLKMDKDTLPDHVKSLGDATATTYRENEDEFFRPSLTRVTDIGENGPILAAGYLTSRQYGLYTESQTRPGQVLRKELSARKVKGREEEWKLRRLRKRDEGIVNAAIEDVLKEAEAKEGGEAKKRDFDECAKGGPCGISVPARPAKGNVFSMMMKAQKEKKSLGKWTNLSVAFENWSPRFEQLLDQMDEGKYQEWRSTSAFTNMEKEEWAGNVARSIEDSIRETILPYLTHAPHIQTKINALHVMIEVPCAIAYAPERATSNRL